MALHREVGAAQLPGLDLRQHLGHVGVDPLPARAHLAGGGAEAAIELAATVHGADDGVERDRLQAEIALAVPTERLHDLLEGKDQVYVARLAPQPVRQPLERSLPPGAAE